MSKNEKEKTKSVNATVLAETSVNTTKTTLQTSRLDKTGCRMLASRVIRQAYEDGDKFFFDSPMYDFWAAIAYDLKADYISEEVIDMINHTTRSQRRSPRGRPSG